MTKHKIYMGVSCIHSDQPKSHSNSSISFSGHIIPKNGIQTSAFHPTMHKNIESILMPSVQVYHHLRLWLTKIKLNHT